MTDVTNETEDELAGLDDRSREMAEKYRAAKSGDTTTTTTDEGTTGDDKPQRPEHIPEKFWDAEKGEIRVEELAKSYAELERKGKQTEEVTDDTNKGAEGDTADAAKTFASYREAISQKIASGAALTDEDYAPAEKIGLSREDVDMFIAGVQAQGELHKMRVYGEAGGQTAYEDMIKWARDAYSKEEVAAYDRDVHSNDTAVALNAVRGLMARYQLANGRSSRDVTSNGNTTGTTGHYRSKAELIADMSDPKYQKDPAFRERVAQKLSASRSAGIELS